MSVRPIRRHGHEQKVVEGFGIPPWGTVMTFGHRQHSNRYSWEDCIGHSAKPRQKLLQTLRRLRLAPTPIQSIRSRKNKRTGPVQKCGDPIQREGRCSSSRLCWQRNLIPFHSPFCFRRHRCRSGTHRSGPPRTISKDSGATDANQLDFIWKVPLPLYIKNPFVGPRR